MDSGSYGSEIDGVDTSGFLQYTRRQLPNRLRKNSVGLSGLSGLFCCSTQETK
jgi:hypothetical protein